LLLELLEDRAVPATISASEGVLTVADGVGYHSDTACQASEQDDAPQDDIDQAVGDSCSFLSALTSFARNRPEMDSLISEDRAADRDHAPIFVDDHWVELNAEVDGRRAQRDEATMATIDVSGREELPSQPSVNSAAQSQFENWLYPAISLTALTEDSDANDAALTDADKQLLEDALFGEPQVRQDASQAATMLFAHTEAVDHVAVDSYKADLHPPMQWAADACVVATSSWAMTDRAAFTLGAGFDAIPAVMAA
jgi:hypothetical protein